MRWEVRSFTRKVLFGGGFILCLFQCFTIPHAGSLCLTLALQAVNKFYRNGRKGGAKYARFFITVPQFNISFSVMKFPLKNFLIWYCIKEPHKQILILGGIKNF
jgi:hypothetical protein